MTTQTDAERAKEQAKAQLESILGMVKRLEHCPDCTGESDGEEGCQLSDAEILEGINIYFKEGMTASDEDRESYHNEEEARQAISEDPLSVEVRADWHTPGEDENKPTEYCILLCTGGPAVRIIGDLDEHQQPDTANLEYQDWFTPWIKYYDTNEEEDEALLTYARQFYFGD